MPYIGGSWCGVCDYMPVLADNLDMVQISWAGGFLLVVAVLLMVLLHFIAEPMRWWVYISAGKNDLSLTRYISVFNLSALLSYTMPFKMGLPARIWLVSKFLHVDTKLIIALITADGLLYYSMWGLAGVVSGYGYLDSVLPNARGDLYLWLSLGAALICIIIAWRLGIRNPHGRLKIQIRRVREFIPWRRVVVIMLIIAVDFVSQLARHWLIAKGLSLELGFIDMSRITSIAIFAGMLSFLPLGLGAYDATMVALLVANGIPLKQAIVIPLANRIFSYMVAVIAGGVGAYHLKVRRLFEGGISSTLQSIAGKAGKEL